MDEIGRPAQVDTKFVSIKLRIPIAESDGWDDLSEEQINTNIEEIAKVGLFAAAILEAVMIDPAGLPFVYSLAKTAAGMIEAEYNTEVQD